MEKVIVENCDNSDNSEALVDEYITRVIHEITSDKVETNNDCSELDIDVRVEKIYQILTSRQFTHQSKTKVSHLKAYVCKNIREDIEKNRSLEVYYDLGGGYHADISEKNASKIDRYGVGISELLVIYQIKMADRKIREFYSPGIFFHIVIDNYVAYLVNDIPLEETKRYCKSLLNMIKLLKMENSIDLLVESENEFVVNNLKDTNYDSNVAITEAEYENVQRFSKCKLTYEDACKRYSAYKSICEKSDELINYHIGNRIRFLQYSKGGDMTFRSYPGGASRIQCGYIGFEIRDARIKPKLYTNTNYSEKICSIKEIDLREKIISCLV